jgi:cell division protein ZapE
MPQLDQLWRALETTPQTGLLKRLGLRNHMPARGIYLWGGVGRGKTMLMDLLLASLSSPRKTRAHFHRFMARVHESLQRHASVRNPLREVAREWSRECDVLCFDEFFVTDIADAMLLGGLLEALLEEGVTLVATSNVHPDDLYKDGLQRARFLPAIECIKRHCQVLELGGSQDHRLRILERNGVFQPTLGPGSVAWMERAYERFSGGQDLSPSFKANRRSFRACRRGLGVVWFDFDELCRKPRSPLDYIELARGFNTVLISGIPQLDDGSADAVRRFISLVDEFYDRNVKLVVSAAAEPRQLYVGERLAFEFRRTHSRLVEMQGHEYLARPHVP